MMAYDWSKHGTHELECKKAEYLGHLETSKRRKSDNMTSLRKGWTISVKEINAILNERKDNADNMR